LLLRADEWEACPGLKGFDVLLMAIFNTTMEAEVIYGALLNLCVAISVGFRIVPVRVLLEILYLYHCIDVSVCFWINRVEKYRFVPILTLAYDPKSHKVRFGVLSWLKLIKVDAIILKPDAVVFFQN
jgi:hypothetical protein